MISQRQNCSAVNAFIKVLQPPSLQIQQVLEHTSLTQRSNHNIRLRHDVLHFCFLILEKLSSTITFAARHIALGLFQETKLYDKCTSVSTRLRES